MSRRLGIRRDLCAVCNLPVFLAEKLVISRKTYHRICFKCARCSNQLTLGNFYETEDGDYCCETCPDEDKSSQMTDSSDSHQEIPLPMTKSISDEEKTKNLTKIENIEISKTSKMRLNFMSDHLESSSNDTNFMNQLPTSSSSPLIKIHSNTIKSDCVVDKVTENYNFNELTATNVNLSDKNNKIVCQNTKETLGVDDDIDNTSQCLSIVQERLKLFEKNENKKIIKKIKIDDSHDNEDKNIEPDSLDILDSSEPQEDPEESKISEESQIKNSNNEIDILNAEGIDLSAQNVDLSAENIDVSTDNVNLNVENYPEEFNPFKSDDEESPHQNPKSCKNSTNPFTSSEDEEEQQVPIPAVRKHIENDEEPVKRKLEAPQINLNPFWSDEDDEESDRETVPTVPIPKPRSIRQTPEGNSSLRTNLDRSGFYASSSSLASSSSTPGGTYRKRKPAPPPPPKPNERVSDVSDVIKSPQSSQNSPIIRTTPRLRKMKPAPPPPLPTSLLSTLSLDSPEISWEDAKISKNQSNKSKQSQKSPISDDNETFSFIDKSSQGKWKRKKGPAPARPIPQRRKIKVMSLKDVKMELDEIEVQQQGLEKQGVRLEQLIRDKCENGNDNDEKPENMTMDVEELVLELFSLVNEKNELFRRQAELMLLKRQQRLEEEHADIEYQIRCLMCQPEATKTDFDKQREESLIQRLVEIVERRSEIVECLEMDRKREVEEDKSINMHMGLYAAKSKGDLSVEIEESPKSLKSKKFKIKEIIKEKHLKKIHKKDADKDIDETEIKLKRQNKKKWF